MQNNGLEFGTQEYDCLVRRINTGQIKKVHASDLISHLFALKLLDKTKPPKESAQARTEFITKPYTITQRPASAVKLTQTLSSPPSRLLSSNGFDKRGNDIREDLNGRLNALQLSAPYRSSNTPHSRLDSPNPEGENLASRLLVSPPKLENVSTSIFDHSQTGVISPNVGRLSRNSQRDRYTPVQQQVNIYRSQRPLELTSTKVSSEIVEPKRLSYGYRREDYASPSNGREVSTERGYSRYSANGEIKSAPIQRPIYSRTPSEIKTSFDQVEQPNTYMATHHTSLRNKYDPKQHNYVYYGSTDPNISRTSTTSESKLASYKKYLTNKDKKDEEEYEYHGYDLNGNKRSTPIYKNSEHKGSVEVAVSRISSQRNNQYQSRISPTNTKSHQDKDGNNYSYYGYDSNGDIRVTPVFNSMYDKEPNVQGVRKNSTKITEQPYRTSYDINNKDQNNRIYPDQYKRGDYVYYRSNQFEANKNIPISSPSNNYQNINSSVAKPSIDNAGQYDNKQNVYSNSTVKEHSSNYNANVRREYIYDQSKEGIRNTPTTDGINTDVEKNVSSNKYLLGIDYTKPSNYAADIKPTSTKSNYNDKPPLSNYGVAPSKYTSDVSTTDLYSQTFSGPINNNVVQTTHDVNAQSNYSSSSYGQVVQGGDRNKRSYTNKIEQSAQPVNHEESILTTFSKSAEARYKLAQDILNKARASKQNTSDEQNGQNASKNDIEQRAIESIRTPSFFPEINDNQTTPIPNNVNTVSSAILKKTTAIKRGVKTESVNPVNNNSNKNSTSINNQQARIVQ